MIATHNHQDDLSQRFLRTQLLSLNTVFPLISAVPKINAAKLKCIWNKVVTYEKLLVVVAYIGIYIKMVTMLVNWKDKITNF